MGIDRGDETPKQSEQTPEEDLNAASTGSTPTEIAVSSRLKQAEELHIHPLALFQWKAFLLFVAIVSIAILAWSSTSDIFEVPQEVQSTYATYKQAKRHYFQNPLYWDSKRDHFEQLIKTAIYTDPGSGHAELLLETLTPEIFISCLASKLLLSPERLNMISIMPKTSSTNFTLIFSKPEQAIWPLQVILSLEAQVGLQPDGITLLFTRLRRGSADIATGLAWAYFGSELEALKKLPIISMKAAQSTSYHDYSLADGEETEIEEDRPLQPETYTQHPEPFQ